MSKYTVKQLSELAGVSIRTLHHYDEIGLLNPHSRGMDSGYRYYGKDELMRLQQVLFYRELDYPLKEISKILDDPDFDLIKSLEFHKVALDKRAKRLDTLLLTIDKTIVKLKNKEMMKDEEIYEGFPKGKEYRAEAAERWGEEAVANVEDNIKAMGKQEWQDVKQEADEINQWLAKVMDQSPSSKDVQVIIAKHFTHLNRFYEVSEARYRGLGQMYVDDERFKSNYDSVAEGLAEFLNKGIQVFCDNGLKA